MIASLRNPRLSLVCFDLGGQRYAIAASHVERILPIAEVEAVPGSPPLLHGFLNLAGSTLPVVRLNRLFELPETPLGLWTPLIVLRRTEQRFALLVDKVTQVLVIDEQHLRPLPAESAFNDCVLGIVRYNGTSMMVLAAERLLLKKERLALSSFQMLAEARLNQLEGVEA